MPIRITGMNSGLDTESIITELIKAKSTKKDNLVKAQKKLEYKQEAWKTLNSKVYTLYSKTLSNLTYTSAYKKQKATVSDSSVASVITGKDASNGVQNLTVESLAKSGYLTGAQLSENQTYTSSTKLCDIATKQSDGTYSKLVNEGDTVSFSITTGGKTTDINLTGASTIGDVVSQLKNAGVNANFDAKNQRLFISAKTTGKDADFAITASTAEGFNALSALGINVMDTQTKAEYTKLAELSEEEKNAMIDAEVTRQKELTSKEVEALEATISQLQTKIEDILTENDYINSASIDTDYETLVAEKEAKSSAVEGESEEEKTAREEAVKELEKKIAVYDSYKTATASLEMAETNKAVADAKLNGGIRASVTADVESKISYAQTVVNNGFAGTSAGATRIEGEDATITLNEATFVSSSNTFEINGLTITATKETKDDEVVTITTADDYDAIYDTIKNFLKEYNTLINEMDKLYNAESAKGYEPLTDEEKEELSDNEIEKWEQKIKDSILRRDSSVSEISSLMKNAMMKGYEVDGQTMYLSSFGINTLGYFTSADNEKSAYHIDGDPDDENTMGNTDILKSMIANDPEKVISFFTQLSRELYSQLGTKMKSDDYSSFNKVYNDKQMKSDYDNYTKKIAEQEEKITAAEDKYYKQFSAMETALAKLQSKESALSGLFGG